MKISAFAAGLALALSSLVAQAGDTLPYSQQTFDQLAKAGKPVIVDVYASWCTTCAAQKPIQQSLLASPKYKDITMLTIDFDAQKALVAKYKASVQSTMIAFKDGKEVGRSVGDTTQEGIEGLFKKTLK